MNRFQFLLDRTAVLFLGMAAGAAIGFGFASGNSRREAVSLAPEAAPVINAPAAISPPPPTAPAAPPTGEAPAAPVAEPVKVAPVPADTPPPQMIQSAREGGLVRIGVFGDSFGDGVYSGLYRLLSAKDGFQVTKYSQQSTGFTRYRRLNLQEHDDAQLDGQPLDVAVIAFGANDAQGVCDAGHCGTLMSTYWQDVIARRVEAYVAMLRGHGAAVYWVGMPVMRDAAFDGDAAAMNGFYTRLMARLGVPFVDIRPLTTGAGGRYQDYYVDGDGTQKLLRAGDGIHMSMNGYIHVTKALASRIRATVSAARTASAEPADGEASRP